MNNFATNQSVGGLKAIVNFAKGRQNAVDNENKLNAKPLKFLFGGKMLGNAWNKFIASIPQSIEQMFKSQSKALLFEKISGFTTIRNGVAKADKLAQNITEAYYDKFINPGGLRSNVKLGNTKTMPNGKRFNDVENDWLFFGVHNSYTRLYYSGSPKVETTSSGVTVTGDINSSSDIRYKKNIETIDNALDKVQSLRGVTFDWDNDAFTEDENTKKPNFTDRATGVIAQDVEKVLPEAVRENEDGFKNVSYGNMVGLLIEAIKEQQAQIDELKAQLNS